MAPAAEQAPTSREQAPVERPLAAAPPLDPRRWSPRAQSIGLLLAGFVLRLALSPFGGFQADIDLTSSWGIRLATRPIGDFYANSRAVDHLPGDLWLVWYVFNFYRALSPSMPVDTFGFTILFKLVPVLADTATGLVLYLIGRDLAGPAIGRLTAAFYLFNPAPIFIASIWGQWDAVSSLPAMLALWFAARGKFQFALPALAYAALVKPQVGALAPLLALAYVRADLLPAIRRSWGGSAWAAFGMLWRPVGRGLAAAALALAVVVAVAVPFGVGIPPLHTRWSLVDRMRIAWETHNRTSLNALTLWATPLAGNGLVDNRTFLGLSERVWGEVLLVLAIVAILVRFWRWGGEKALVWAWLATNFALYVLPTRVHERYLLTTVVAAALAAGLAPRLRWFYLVLSGLFLGDLVAVYWLAHDVVSGPAPLFAPHNPLVIVASLLCVALFVYVVSRALPELEHSGKPGRIGFPTRRGTRRGRDAD